MNYLFDACALLNLANGGILKITLSLPGNGFFLCSVARREARSISTFLNTLIASGALRLIEDDEIPAATFLDLKERYGLGDGETECIVASMARDCALVFDDQKARRVAQELLGPARVTGSIGILRVCVTQGLLSKAEAFGAYKIMKAVGGYLPEMQLEQMFP